MSWYGVSMQKQYHNRTTFSGIANVCGDFLVPMHDAPVLVFSRDTSM